MNCNKDATVLLNIVGWACLVALLFVRQITSVGFNEFDDDDNDGELVRLPRSDYTKGNKIGWCYIKSTCYEKSLTSDWQQGTCGSGQRQSPIDIKTSNLGFVTVTRKKRRITLRRHRPKGELDIEGVPLSPVFSPPLVPAFQLGQNGDKSVVISATNKDAIVIARPRQQQVQMPSTVEQGLLCSPQPHWNIIWVSGKPYRYWIQMHICRLILRQRAQFIVKHVNSGTSPEDQGDGQDNKNSTSALPTLPPQTHNQNETITIPLETFTSPTAPSVDSTPQPTTPTPLRLSTDSTPPPTIPPPTTPPSTTPAPLPLSTDSTPPPSTPASLPLSTESTQPPPPISTQSTVTLTPPLERSAPITLDFTKSRRNYVMKQFQLENNGRTIILGDFIPETGTNPTFSWPEQQNAIYKLDSVHFHWGPHDNIGSEHTVDGIAYTAEMHLVHYRSTEGNAGFSDLKSAVQSGEGNALAVIGVFLQVDDSITTSFMQPHIYNFVTVPRKGDKMTVICDDSRLRLDQVLEKITQAYHYMGSFTTPGCNEIVAWLVGRTPIKIARQDIQALRSAVREDEYPLIMNYRSTQHSNQPVSLVGIRE